MKILSKIIELINRKKVLFIGMASAGFLFVPVLVLGGHEVIELVDSAAFCVGVCHNVHYAEGATYEASPHSEVTCAQCHVGAGPGNMVSSKIRGLSDIIPAITGQFARPITTPIETLRPSSETCEKCHWSERFTGDMPLIETNYHADVSNTKDSFTLVLKVNGGKKEVASGIHWHGTARVWYLPLDEKRLKIGWIASESSSGDVTQYIDPERLNEITPERIQNEKRLMDCVDCHNRVSHLFRSPDDLINSALTDGSIDVKLPFIKKQALDALVPQNPSLEEAYTKIAKIKDYYQTAYPEIFQRDFQSIDEATTKLDEIARLTTFPDNLDWNTHLDNAAHDLPDSDLQIDWNTISKRDESAGCFRCHGNLVKLDASARGSLDAVLQGLKLTAVTSVFAQSAVSFENTTTDGNSPDIAILEGNLHQDNLLNKDCDLCHYTPKSPSASPLAPATSHPIDGLDNCLVCHSPSSSKPFKADHPWATNEACNSCHQSAPKILTFAVEVKEAKQITHSLTGLEECLSCHGPLGRQPVSQEHPWSTKETCGACHQPSGSPQPLPEVTPPKGKQIPHSITGLGECLSCHGPTGTRPFKSEHPWATNDTCIACHQVAPALQPLPTSTPPVGKVITHSTTGLEDCIICHNSTSSVSPLPTGHPWVTSSACTVCHQKSPLLSSIQTVTVPPGPEIKHSLAGINTCISCHYSSGPGPFPSSHLGRPESFCLICHKPSNVPVVNPPPVPGGGGSIDAAALYASNCVACHGANRQGGVGPAITEAALSSYTVEQISTGISGHASNSSKLTSAEISALAQWLKGTSTVTVPAAPTGLTATALNAGQVNLSWVDNAANETGYRLERAANSSFTAGFTTVNLSAGAASYSDSTVTGSNTYYYRVFASNSAGYSNASNTATATTPVSTITAPAAPANLTATVVNAGLVNLSWVDNATNETGYRVERVTNSTFTAGLNTVSLAAGNVSYSDNSVAGSTTYYYRVVAYNSGGDSTASNTATVTTSAATIDAAALYTAKCASCHGANRQGDIGPAITAAALSSLTVQQVTTSISGHASNSSKLTSAEISALAQWLKGTSTVTTPTAPSGLTATAAGAGQVNLSWSDNAANETGYRLERAANSSFTAGFTTVNLSAGATSYSDSTVTGSTTYYYRVFASNSAGYSNASNTATVTTPAPSVAVPSAPTGLTATATGAGQVNLSWVDNAANETGYRLERAANNSFTAGFTTVNLSAGAASYNDSTVTGSTTYYYRVFASNSAGYSNASNTATVTTPAPSVAVPSAPTGLTATATGAGQVNLSWVDNAANETGYRLERAANNSFTAGFTTVNLSAGAASYSDSTVTGSTTYYYRVFASNSAGYSNASNTATVTTPAPTITVPSAPTSLTATAVNAGQVNLSWADNAANETGYRLQRATNNSFSAGLTTVNLSAGTTSYSDSTVTGSTTYYYRVNAVNSAGNSTVSNTATVTTQSSTATVSYSATIQPMLNQYCNSCHNSRSPRLTTYAQVYSARNNLPGMGSSYLTNAQEQTIATWISQGAPNN